MSQRIPRALLACALLSFSLLAQDPGLQSVRLVYGTFDPLVSAPQVPGKLSADAATRLWIVQFDGLPTEAGRQAVTAAGGEVHGYLPDTCHVVRMDPEAVGAVAALEGVRWVGAYHPAYRLEPDLRNALAGGVDLPAARYNIVVVDKHTDKPALARNIAAIGGRVDDEQTGSLLMEVTLTGEQLRQAANFDEVLWIDRWTPNELDMDNARIQGGGNYVESQGGYTGSGVNAHIYEGIEATHQDFTGGATNVRSSGAAATHGHATAGIVFGNGMSNPAVRGMAPDVGKFYTNYSSVSGSRYQVVSDLVNMYEVSHTTASWGGGRTLAYTSISADTDDIIFDHDIPWTQSQSNAGNQQSRPQAWAKNVFSIGGVAHRDNSNPADDSWQAGGASTGPAADGRIKPTLCAYYDAIGTSDRTGSAGYSSGNWYASFGGTSGATPIVAGHNLLAIQMFTDGAFGNTLRNPGGSRHSNRPHFTTLKALQVVSAAQYPFTSSSTDNRREHQGWGFPDLRKMWDNRMKTFLVDETDVLTQAQASRWDITVMPGEPELKVCMNYADPAANPAAGMARINDLSMRVTAPDGTTYWGNNGLEDGVWSQAGGSEDGINPIECVFVQNPQAGVWHVDVIATLVAQDSHVETAAMDADYGLAVSGGTGQRGTPPVFGSFTAFGQGCPGSVVLPPVCAQLNPGGGTLSGATNTNEYAYTVNGAGSLQVLSFDIFSGSTTGGSRTIGAYIYADAGGQPGASPIATTAITLGPTPAFYTAMFPGPVAVSGTFYIALDHTVGQTLLSTLTSGTPGSAYWRSNALSGSWSLSGVVSTPSYRVTCMGSGGNAVAEIGNDGVATIGQSFDVTLGMALPNASALAVLGFSDTVFSGGSLPFSLPGAPGCDLLVSPDSWILIQTSGSGEGSATYAVPNSAGFIGFDLFHQWLIADPVNTLGFVTSDGGKSTIGS